MLFAAVGAAAAHMTLHAASPPGVAMLPMWAAQWCEWAQRSSLGLRQFNQARGLTKIAWCSAHAPQLLSSSQARCKFCGPEAINQW